MADLIIPTALTGKYFINSLHVHLGGTALMRGRILGPIATELSPYYLCDIYPADDAQIAVTTQMILQLDQLVGVYFYDSRALLDAAWIETQRRLQATAAATQRERQQAVAAMRQQVCTMLASSRRGVGLPAADLDQIVADLVDMECAAAAEAAEADDDDDA